jgi:DtxR family Mn-dependent transcriptional regulator
MVIKMTNSIGGHQEVEQQPPTATIEDYLWMIFTLQRDGELVIGARLAELLEVSAPTVTVTLKRMARDGWIEIDDKKRVSLTPEGKDAARTVLKRHMLVEWLLVKMLDVPWATLHDEAHKLEHYISDDIELRLRTQMDDPKVCPHGNPLPGNEDAVKDWINLLDIHEGNQVIIRRIHEHAENKPKLMRFFAENLVIPGNSAVVMEVLPYNQTVTLGINSHKVSLGMTAAKFIFVEPLQ